MEAERETATGGTTGNENAEMEGRGSATTAQTTICRLNMQHKIEIQEKGQTEVIGQNGQTVREPQKETEIGIGTGREIEIGTVIETGRRPGTETTTRRFL